MGLESFVRIWLAVAVLGWSDLATTGPAAAAGDRHETRPLLDVPFVPQSGQLCGGAALAMVLRYWGETGIMAEDFALLAKAGEDGIRTGALVSAIEDRGWTALRLPGTPAAVAAHLARGRPVIALLQVGADRYHYVVLVAWTGRSVILHDPRIGPFRLLSRESFTAAWSGSGRWALLVLPPPPADRQDSLLTEATGPLLPARSDDCGDLVQEGIRLAALGDTAAAERAFFAAQASSPAAAAPLRERAGLRFRAEDWPGASRLAQRAVDLDPADVHAWRLLAGSRFLARDVPGALAAWNHLSEPRNDLVRIDGLARTRYAAVYAQLGLPAGRVLTPQTYRRAGRRLAELPAATRSRLDLRPLPGGAAQVQVAVLERPLVGMSPWDLARAGTRAFVEREVTVDLASPTGNAELWTATWRWWVARPLVSLALAMPAAGGRPGLWRVDGSWERQTYAAQNRSPASRDLAADLHREERRRTGISFADWLGPDLRLEMGLALDRWDAHGTHLALEGTVETRWAGDRLAATMAVARWLSVDRGAPFTTASVGLRWRSGGTPRGEAWHAHLGMANATARSPLSLWSGAGTGQGRAPLLRAHPLLDEGIITGRVFGRTLAHATLERQAWPWRQGPLRLGWAIFVDCARAWDTGPFGQAPWQVDGGGGLRLRSLGLTGQFRIDVARGFADGNLAGSIAWQIP
jgi:hypothetical protein